MTPSITGLPTLRQLSYLLALHEHRHFGRAAAACAVTQSTLSAGLAELEGGLGARLVERSTRSLSFTALGEDVAARARLLLRAAEDLRDVARGAREPLAGVLRLAVIPTIAPFALPQVVAAAGREWPQLRLVMREMLTGAACEALGRNTVDGVLLALPADCGDVSLMELAADRLLLAAPGGARAASAEASRLLLLDEGHCLRDQALAACRATAPPPETPLVAATLHTLVRMVDAGLGATLLPRMAVEAGVLDGTAVTTAELDPPAERRIALAWRRRSAREDDLRLLGDTLRRALASAGQDLSCATV